MWLLACLAAAGVIFTAGCTGGDVPAATGSETADREFIPSPDGTVRYFVAGPNGGGDVKNDRSAGYISGKRVQTPDESGKYTPVTAVPMPGYRFEKWSDGKTDPTRTEEPGLVPASVTAIFAYDILDMPVIALTTETGKDVTSKEEYVVGTLAAFGTDGRELFGTDAMKIRGRGNSTWYMEKKSYRIKLDEKENLLGVGKGKAKNWVLLANHADHSLQRIADAFCLARMLDGFEYVPGCMFVEVFLNGEYRGVYLLTEQTQTGKSRVSIDESDYETNVHADFLVEKTAWDFDYGFTVKSERYGIKSDLSSDAEIRDAQIEWIDAKVTEACDALAAGNYERVKELVDVDSLVDDYLLQEITRNFDVGFDSFYMYYTDGKLHFGPPWDFDLSLGNANLGFEDPVGFSAAVCPTNGELDTSNRWFYNTVKHAWFRKLVVDRWNEKKGEIMTLPEYVRDTGSGFSRSFERNFEKWEIFGQNFARSTKEITDLKTYEEHCEYLADWLQTRLNWLDEVFNSREFAKGEIF